MDDRSVCYSTEKNFPVVLSALCYLVFSFFMVNLGTFILDVLDAVLDENRSPLPDENKSTSTDMPA